jgi:hypothetical protein
MRPQFPENRTSNLTATFADGRTPTWPAVRALLARRGYAVQMRMIDGQPAFPDEAPPDDWREVRVAAAEGMVTVRREENRLTFVVWSNAGAELRQAANAVAWACAEAGAGRVDTAEGSLDAAAFLRAAELPAALLRQDS